jgi:outer membrane protein
MVSVIASPSYGIYHSLNQWCYAGRIQRIDVTADLIKSSAEAQRLAQARYRLGTSSIVEFNQAELNYTEAELEDATAKYDYQSGLALLKFTTGESP